MDDRPTNLDELIAAGVEARDAASDINWRLGDLVVLYAKMEGGELLPAARTFAGLIGFGQVTTLAQYARVAKFYPPSQRSEDAAWTLFRTAMGQGDDALNWLGAAVEHQWSDAQLKRAIKGEEPVQEKPRCEACGQILKGAA